MTNLNDFGKIAIATAIFYIPIFLTALTIVFRHGFRKDLGWIFLVIFSTGQSRIFHTAALHAEYHYHSPNCRWRYVTSCSIGHTRQHHSIRSSLHMRVGRTIAFASGYLGIP